ncbi:MAG: Lrp/AsnC family transcriptional regulator [Paracoccus sp. (in: a-proteobacteria)]|uniref:Lrp/AsnC family transcriptional regulator n=1 Tax=Paracoccus sp. TaxID=267 RepID=UPI0026DF8337|nr:Lrp/AsnC family transcriptional regulator [Paracoccus sp. (in: a-proteobacteria)]MDO5620817.1 Lrp/AsnC family transcriptional regulator [Paracoccus sp. (in: a-proteobacteria)]
MDIDRTGKRILALLAQNARISATAIGQQVGLSRTAVQDRVAAMEQRGIIQGYHARIAEHVGLVSAILTIQISGRPCDPALRWLAAQEGVETVLSLSGEVDAIAWVTLPDMASLSALTDRVALSPLIASVSSRIILGRYGGT